MTEKPLSAVEKVKEESHGLRGDLAPQLAGGGDHFSDASAQLLKFHGTYQQEDRDQRRALRGTDGEPAHQFMVRCKIPGGVLTGEQYLVRSEEHTSELQSLAYLVCRLLLEKKKTT